MYYYSAAYFHKAASVTSDKFRGFLASFHVTLVTEKSTWKSTKTETALSECSETSCLSVPSQLMGQQRWKRRKSCMFSPIRNPSNWNSIIFYLLVSNGLFFFFFGIMNVSEWKTVAAQVVWVWKKKKRMPNIQNMRFVNNFVM